MTNVLIILTHPEHIRKQYYDHIREKFPGSTVNVVDHHSKVGPYLGPAEVVLTFATMIADHVLSDAQNLKWIHALSTGTDSIEGLPSLRPEVILTSTRGIHGAPMSEAALMAMLALSRDLPRSVRNQDRRSWTRHVPRLLEGKTVGIFGVGVIGAALAPRCKALGMTVVGVDPIKRDGAGVALAVFRREPLPDDHPLWSMENVIITPHLGGLSDEYPKRAFPILDENMRRFLAGDIRNMINLIQR